jgi:hypothetical protein
VGNTEYGTLKNVLLMTVPCFGGIAIKSTIFGAVFSHTKMPTNFEDLFKQ